MDAYTTLSRLAGGTLMDQLTAALDTAADEVIRTGRPSSVTLKLTVTHEPAVAETAVVIHEAISRSPSKRAARPTLFYAGGGTLHNEDPRQPDIPGFRDLNARDAVEIDPEVRGPSDRPAETRARPSGPVEIREAIQ